MLFRSFFCSLSIFKTKRPNQSKFSENAVGRVCLHTAWNNRSRQGVNCPIHLNGVLTSKPPADDLNINIVNYFTADHLSRNFQFVFLSCSKLLSCTFRCQKSQLHIIQLPKSSAPCWEWHWGYFNTQLFNCEDFLNGRLSIYSYHQNSLKKYCTG